MQRTAWQRLANSRQTALAQRGHDVQALARKSRWRRQNALRPGRARRTPVEREAESD
jgi:hypothetical protein